MATDDTRPPPSPAHRLAAAGLRERRGWELHPGVRSPDRLSRRERAADLLRDALGSWAFLVTAVLCLAGGTLLTVPRGRPLDVIAVVLSGVSVVELSVVLMAGRRADRTASEAALYELESARRAAVRLEEIGAELERLRNDLARLGARTNQAPSGSPRGGGLR